MREHLGNLSAKFLTDIFGVVKHGTVKVADRVIQLKKQVASSINNLDKFIETIVHLKVDLTPIKNLFIYIIKKYDSFKQKFTLSNGSVMRAFVKKLESEVNEFLKSFTQYIKTFKFAQEAYQLYIRTLFLLDKVNFFENVEAMVNRCIR